MKVVFPSIPFDSKLVDSDFEQEFEAAQKVDWDCYLYDHELIEQGNVKDALKAIPKSEGENVFQRGWMFTSKKYEDFFDGLISKGYRPIVTPNAYEQSHYLPLAYPLIKKYTAKSDWITGESVNDAWELYRGFIEKDAIIKDWVKSAKHKWKEGCFIPANTDREAFGKIFSVFRKERGKLFNRGVVIREFLSFRINGFDMRGFPCNQETRLFFWNGNLILEPKDSDIMLQKKKWESIASSFQSPFISIDVAPLESGDYLIVEVGDGGVSGLPIGISPIEFFKKIKNLAN